MYNKPMKNIEQKLIKEESSLDVTKLSIVQCLDSNKFPYPYRSSLNFLETVMTQEAFEGKT